MTLCSGVSSWWLTPNTTVRSAPSAGAETMTRLAPASRCFAAAARLVKIPVHSSVTSTPRLRQRSCAGSRSAVTAILPRPISIQLSPVVISPGKPPCTLSYLRRCALVATGPRSLIATISTSSLLVSCAARRTSRPMRPKPLIAIRIAMVRPFELVCLLSLDAPRPRRLDLYQWRRGGTRHHDTVPHPERKTTVHNTATSDWLRVDPNQRQPPERGLHATIDGPAAKPQELLC